MRMLIAFSVVSLLACARESDVIVGSATITKRLTTTQDLDILFVIDNSSSTFDKQTLFASNFLRFVQALDSFPTGRPNLHIGVVTTTVDIGTSQFGPACPSPDVQWNGRLQVAPQITGCMPPTGRFISDIKDSTGGRTTNYTGQLQDVFSCISQVGANGCGFEAPLEAMKRALDGTNPENAGFMRMDAYLAVVILTDEDDASVADPALWTLSPQDTGPADFRSQPLHAYACDQSISVTEAGTYTGCHVIEHGYLTNPASYAQFLAGIKDPELTAVAVIAGDSSSTIATGPISEPFTQPLALLPSCEMTIAGNVAIARPSLRLDDFRAQFDGLERGVFETICRDDYSDALTQIGAKLFEMMSPCLEGNVDPADTDPQNPGIQPACTVTEDHAVIPTCKMSTPTAVNPSSTLPCWYVDANQQCGTASSLEINFDRIVPPAPGVVTDVACARL